MSTGDIMLLLFCASLKSIVTRKALTEWKLLPGRHLQLFYAVIAVQAITDRKITQQYGLIRLKIQSCHCNDVTSIS